MMDTVTTITIMSVTDKDQTWAISSRVVESTDSALDHLRLMGQGHPEPVYVVSEAGWRWTWEYVNELGNRCTDTVRVVA